MDRNELLAEIEELRSENEELRASLVLEREHVQAWIAAWRDLHERTKESGK